MTEQIKHSQRLGGKPRKLPHLQANPLDENTS